MCCLKYMLANAKGPQLPDLGQLLIGFLINTEFSFKVRLWSMIVPKYVSISLLSEYRNALCFINSRQEMMEERDEEEHAAELSS